MAWQIASGITEPTTGANLANAYLKILCVYVDHSAQNLTVNYSIWANQNARETGLAPLFPNRQVISTGNTYVNAIQVAPAANASGNIPSVVDDMLLTNVYVAMPTFDGMNTFLAGATLV